MKTIKIPIRKYRDNAISKPQNTSSHFPLYAGVSKSKCIAMPNTKSKGLVMMSRCAPQMKWKTLSMNSAARPASAMVKYDDIGYERKEINIESKFCGKQKSKLRYLFCMYSYW